MDFKIDPRVQLSHATIPSTDIKSKNLKSLRESSRQFEALFVDEMFKAMRKTVPEGGLFEKDMSTEMYQEMLDMETAKSATQGKGLGIAEAMYNQLSGLIGKTK